MVPRPRFKINDAANNDPDQAESVLSHFSQSEIEQTEGPEPVSGAHGTVTVLNPITGGNVGSTAMKLQAVANRQRQQQHSSHLEQRGSPTKL